MKYIDMHCDTMAELWYARLRGEAFHLQDAPLMINLDKLQAGDCLCQNFAMFVYLHTPADFKGLHRQLEQEDEPPYMDPWLALNGTLRTFQEEMERAGGRIRQVTTGSQIHEALEKGQMTCLLTVEEGAVCQGSLDKLRTLYDAGVRMMTLTWNFENQLAFPNIPDPDHYFHFVPRSDNGLKKRGFEFVEAMQDMGMIVDVSHLSDAGFYDVARTVKGPFAASHSNARGLCGCNRNMTDDMIRILADHGGVMGLNFCPYFLQESDHPAETTERIADMAEYIRRVGGIDVIGIGSDFDGISGQLELAGADQMGLLADALHKKHFSDDEIEKIFYKNVLRVYDEVLG